MGTQIEMEKLVLSLALFASMDVAGATGCERDTGPALPGNGQIFYMEYPVGSSRWMYVTRDGWIRRYPFPRSELVEADDSWPKWRWHDCRNGYVALEPRREGWENYYMNIRPNGWTDAWRSVRPCSDRWTQFKVLPRSASNPREVRLQYRRRTKHGYTVQIYIPPICEKISTADRACNCGQNEATYTIAHSHGISRTESTEHSETVAGRVMSEIRLGIEAAAELGLSGSGQGELSVSESWKHVFSSTWNRSSTRTLELTVAPGTCKVVESKTAVYGEYEVRSSNVNIIDDVPGKDCSA